MPESLFNKTVCGPCNFIKKEILAQVFYGGFCEIFLNTFFTEHLQTKFAKLSDFDLVSGQQIISNH